MRVALYDTTTGRIIQLMDIAGMGMVPPIPGTAALEVDETINDDRHYIDAGVIIERPPRPSKSHDFDWSSKTWLPNLVQAKQSKVRDIEQLRDQQIRSVIVYDGKNLDADERAQKNVSNKLAEIDSREAAGLPMPAGMLVWRDADNVTHTFPDQATYKAWLQGLVVEMSARGTQAYAWSWQKKAEVDAATTYEELQAVSLTV